MTNYFSRKVTINKITCTFADTLEGVLFDEVVILTSKYKTETQQVKAIKEQHETENIKFVSIKSISTEEKLYGIPDAIFFENAVELDEHRKPVIIEVTKAIENK